MATYERRRTNDLIEKQRSNEYVALRAELLSLHERAHAVWRWGLTAIVALLGVMVTVLAGIDKPDYASLKCFLSTCPHIIALVLYLFAAGIAITLANLSANIRNAMNRLGAYMAVFHDQPVIEASPFACSLGWHIWNRIDKMSSPRPPAKWFKTLGPTLCKMFKAWRSDAKKTRSSTEHHGEPWVYVVVLGFFVTFVSGLLKAIASISVSFVGLILLGFTTVAVVWLCLEVIEQRYIDTSFWTRRWFQLCQNENEIKQAWYLLTK
jgi:hypothetical protein